MKIKYIMVLTAFGLMLSGCATKNKYHFDFAVRSESYVENYGTSLSTQLTSQLGKTTTTLSGDNSKSSLTGTGITIGVLETLPSGWSSRLALTMTTYSTMSYTFNIATVGIVSETILTNSMAFDGSIGYSFKYFRPYLSYSIDSRSYTVLVTPATSGLSSSSGSISFWGGGLEFKFPTWDDNEMYLSYEVRSARNMPSGSATLNSIQLGMRF